MDQQQLKMKNYQDGSKIGPQGCLGGVGGPSWPQEPARLQQVRSTPIIFCSIWEPFWRPKSKPKSRKKHQKYDQQIS